MDQLLWQRFGARQGVGDGVVAHEIALVLHREGIPEVRQDRLPRRHRLGLQLAAVRAVLQLGLAGAIGPLGVRIEPWGKTGVDEAREYFREQAAALVEGGVDLLMLETFRDWHEAAAAIDASMTRTAQRPLRERCSAATQLDAGAPSSPISHSSGSGAIGYSSSSIARTSLSAIT